MTFLLAPHGSPYDRGDADRYYGRPARPHRWLDDIGRNEVTNLSPAEVAEYRRGHNENPSGRKEW